MNSGPPSIIVTLPARGVAEARAQMAGAAGTEADLFEIRFDRFPETELARVPELFPSKVPLVATLRSRAEGGEGPDDPESRARLLVEFSHHPFRWVDIEFARDLRLAESLARPGQLGLIVSSHCGGPVNVEEWSRLVRTGVPPGSIRKVVAPASVGQLLREFLPALPPAGESPLVALTTGSSGPLLRTWSRRLGFPMVYASLPETSGANSTPAVEPSQIPADRLRGYLDAEGTPAIFALVGRPVSHSRSPAIHAHWMRARHEMGLYVALEFESDREFVESIPPLFEGGFRGFNVTHPFKEVALELADRVGPGATACGVANTLSLVPDGVEAENTDLVAILRRLEELRDSGRWDGTSLGVIGAGGAARATLAAARSLGVPAKVWARRPETAELLAREFSAESVVSMEEHGPPLVIQATTVGRDAIGFGSVPEIRNWIRSGVHVVDWVYDPESPIVRDTAKAVGATYEDGSRLLLYQAAASYGIWWGDEPTPEQISAELGADR
ncbi:MAG: type I 3-dehydroquinate dehydratase [Thermoplasmata archaeon]